MYEVGVVVLLLVLFLLLAGFAFLKFISYSDTLRDEPEYKAHPVKSVDKPIAVTERGSSFRKWITRSFHKKRRRRRKYRPGRLGVSMVSVSIIEDYGSFVPRRERRWMARSHGRRFVAYYND